MREIKFRAYHYGADYSVRPEMLYDEKLGDVLRWKREGQDLSDVMQYTGLKDKNGHEIYEGDILDYRWKASTRNLLIVEWSEKEACFLIGGVKTDYAIAYGEVVGNIYENPGLLEGGD